MEPSRGLVGGKVKTARLFKTLRGEHMNDGFESNARPFMSDEEMKAFFAAENERSARTGAKLVCRERGRVLCEEALKVINGERQDQYGRPEDTFARIAHLWMAYLTDVGTPVTIDPAMVADMMCLLKIARERGGKGKKDNYVDAVGYAALAATMRGYD